ncbi:CRISPR-associated endonuclease Cas1, partial [Micrococcus sp. SIMBA_144]
MGYCADNNIGMTFLTMDGRFLAKVIGMSRGNVHLRKKQYQFSENLDTSALISRNFIIGKVFNQKWMLERAKRNYPLRVDTEEVNKISSKLSRKIKEIHLCSDLDRLRGLEGQAATDYNEG